LQQKLRNTPSPKAPIVRLSLVERAITKKWRFGDYGSPHKIMLKIGYRLVRFQRRVMEPVKEKRNVLGQEMTVCVYPVWWWEQYGDVIVEQSLERLAAKKARNSELVATAIAE
jgi:hypothetical protein